MGISLALETLKPINGNRIYLVWNEGTMLVVIGVEVEGVSVLGSITLNSM